MFNQTAGRSYVLVALHDPLTVMQYQQRGYKKERWNFRPARPGCPQSRQRDGYELDAQGEFIPMNAFAGTLTGDERNGSEVHLVGCVLMSIPTAKKRQIEQHGSMIDGTTGQAGADELDQWMIQHRYFDDIARGIKALGVSPDAIQDRSGLHQHGEVVEEYY